MSLSNTIVRVYLIATCIAFLGLVAIGFADGSLGKVAAHPSTANFLRSLFLLPLSFVAVALAGKQLEWTTARFPLFVAAIGVSTFYLPGAVIVALAVGLVWVLRDAPWLSTTPSGLPQSGQWPMVCGVILAGWALRLLSVEEPFERDLMVYAMMASGWLEGLPLYAGIWDHKPPALYMVYAGAIALFGQNLWAIYALNCLFFATTLLGVHRAAQHLAGPRAAMFAVVIWGVTGSDLILQANQPNVEVFMNTCLIWALVLLLARPERPASWLRICLVGLLFFVASTFKQIAVFPAAFIAIALIINNRSAGGGGLRSLFNPGLSRALLLGVIGAGGWISVFAVFHFDGTFDAFFYAVFDYNREYAGSLLGSLSTGFTDNPLSFYSFVFIALAALHLRNARSAPHCLMAAAYLGTFLMFAMPGKYWPHYYQLFLPLIAISGGSILAHVFPQGSVVRICAVLLAPIWLGFAFMTTPERMAYVKYNADRHGGASVESKDIGLWFADNDIKATQVLHWGAEPGIYFWSGTPTLYKFPFNYPLIRGSRRDEMSQEFIQQAMCAPPEILVVNKVRTHHRVGPAWAFLAEHFAVDPTLPNYRNFELWVAQKALPECVGSS